MSRLVRSCQSSLCQGLRAEAAKLARLKTDAAAAAAAYKPPDGRTAPPGYHNATPAELRRMNLSPAMLEHPHDPVAGKASEFRAAVFVHDTTGESIVAFKGTTATSWADWGENAAQYREKDSFYYAQAQKIGTRVAASPAANSVHYTGHSLGGGLASAAWKVSGRPASTFNAATLQKGTVARPAGQLAGLDAVTIKGEPLTTIQNRFNNLTAGTRPYALDPPPMAALVERDIPWYRLDQKASAMAARQTALHSMDAVEGAIAQRAVAVAAAIRKNGC